MIKLMVDFTQSETENPIFTPPATPNFEAALFVVDFTGVIGIYIFQQGAKRPALASVDHRRYVPVII